MQMSVVWFAAIIVFAVGEALSMGLTSIWFALGSAVAMLAAILGFGLGIQITLFLLVTALALFFTRPLAKKYLNTKTERTNADRIVGMNAIVTEEINNTLAHGAAKVAGQEWTARSIDNSVICAGSLVEVCSISGAKVIVKQVK